MLRHLNWLLVPGVTLESTHVRPDLDHTGEQAHKYRVLELYWLIEQLEALVVDPVIALGPLVRGKCLLRLAAVRSSVNEDPVSAAWTLRQVYNRIRQTVSQGQ